jgi:hypothetical protein
MTGVGGHPKIPPPGSTTREESVHEQEGSEMLGRGAKGHRGGHQDGEEGLSEEWKPQRRRARQEDLKVYEEVAGPGNSGREWVSGGRLQRRGAGSGACSKPGRPSQLARTLVRGRSAGRKPRSISHGITISKGGIFNWPEFPEPAPDPDLHWIQCFAVRRQT